MAEPTLSAPVPRTPDLRARSILLLFLLVVLVFHPALQGEFLRWDDDTYLSNNPHLKGLGWAQLAWMFGDATSAWRYQPLSWLTWNTIYQFVGLKPLFYHLVVVLFHAVNAGLVFLLIDRLLRLARPPALAPEDTVIRICAALAAALWAVHPLRVETTAWAVELVYVQALCFFLLALLAYLRAAYAERRGRFFYCAGIACFAASLFSYPVALGGLAVLAALDVYPLRRLSLHPGEWFKPAVRHVWLEKIPFLALTLLAAWANLHARGQDGARWGRPPSLEEFDLLSRAMQSSYIWASNVWKPLAPLPLTPVPMQLYEFNPLDARFVGSAIFVVGLTIALLALRHRWPAMLLAWLCHLALLVPMLGLAERPHFPADRYNLVVSIGLAVLLADAFRRLWVGLPARRILIAVLAGLIPALGVLSYRQTLVWQTNERLFAHVLAHLPAEPRGDFFRFAIHVRLGAHRLDRRDFTRAAAAFRDAIRVRPADGQAHVLLGYSLMRTGDLETARANYAEGTRLSPDLVPMLNDLALAYAERGDTRKAVELLGIVLRHDPGNETAKRYLSRALAPPGRTN